jgi:hypothetical protein
MNWGTGITIVIVFFILMTLGFVTVAVRNDNELVAEDYYDQELGYQDKLNYAHNAKGSGINPKVSQTETGCIRVDFSTAVSGTLVLFRPSDKTMDSQASFESQADSTWKHCPDKLPRGMWKVSLTWLYQGKTCYSEHSLNTQL